MGIALAAMIVGALAGVLAGLFGVGGGILFVPTLTFTLGLEQIHAQATSLLAILPTVAVGTWRQQRYGNVRWRAPSSSACPESQASSPADSSPSPSPTTRCDGCSEP